MAAGVGDATIGSGEMIDYSEYGQALLFPQLLTADTPRVLVDIGAHDGVTGSNSRSLLEAGWRGVLVEPAPQVFARLRESSASLKSVALVNAACSNRNGKAAMRVGLDGEMSAMHSLSEHPEIGGNLGKESFPVATITLAEILSRNDVPEDFGILMVDTEGLDLVVLQQLEHLAARPRIIVTEDFAPTDAAKYALLDRLGYRFVGIWGADSFWLSPAQQVDISSLRLPIFRLPPDWKPSGTRVEGTVSCDRFLRPTILGWAFLSADQPPPVWAAIELKRSNSAGRYLFRGLRFPRPDVSHHFHSACLEMSGLRVPIDVFPGDYSLRIIQQTPDAYSENEAGSLCIPY